MVVKLAEDDPAILVRGLARDLKSTIMKGGKVNPRASQAGNVGESQPQKKGLVSRVLRRTTSDPIPEGSGSSGPIFKNSSGQGRLFGRS